MTPSSSASDRPGGVAPPALHLDRVAHRYGHETALAPLTLRLAAGAVCAVSGGNGAGKTTLLRIAAGLIEPTSGSRSAVGPALYLRPGAGARRAQRVVDAVAFAGALAGRRDPASDAAEALAACDLPADLWGREAGRLSAGQRARVTLAVARVVSPAVLCLDEPLEHLDAPGRSAVWRTVGDLTAGGTAVLVAGSDVGGSDVGGSDVGGSDVGGHLAPVDARLVMVSGAATVTG
ncbi:MULTISPECIES: ABC transporter ATP-binding protein [unclassified Modestobacter]